MYPPDQGLSAFIGAPMKDWNLIHKRFLHDTIPLRLGALAANLSRIKSFATHDTNRETVAGLIEESKFFIEWTAPEAATDTAAQLVELQVQLARWQYRWAQIWSDPAQRQQVAEQSSIWSERVLALSGLLKA
jgi:hypothetical protein